MLPRRYFRLTTLGPLSLTRVAGDAESVVSARPRHLAVLTVVATARRPISRDALLAMFWGGETESRARHSLSNALSGLRSILGADAIASRSDQVALGERAQIEVDLVQFEAACESHDDARAAEVYRGPFLEGLYIPDAPEFEAWLARERSRAERLFLEMCDRRVPALLRASEWKDAISLAERWAEAVPSSAAALAALLRAHAGPGTPAALTAASNVFEQRRAWLFENFGTKPDASVVALVRSLRDDLARRDVETARDAGMAKTEAETGDDAVPRLTPLKLIPTGEMPAAETRRPRPRWLFAGIAAGVIAIIGVGGWAVRYRVAAADADRPAVAIVGIEDVRGDTNIDWLRAGLARMIATDLGSIGGVDVVPSPRVRDVLARLAPSDSAHLTQAQALDIGRRVGAAWVVTGGVSNGNRGYLLDMSVRSVTDPRTAESFTILSTDPIDLGRQASVRLASAMHVVGASRAPAYADIETTNPDAYRHFVRALMAQEGERVTEATHEADAALALDSGFVEAMRLRMRLAYRLGDTTLAQRLRAKMQPLLSRLSEFDRMDDEIVDADSSGESTRAMALATRFVERFPYDPRAYSRRAEVIMTHGQWAAAESVIVRELALDSLAIAAGDGPCIPCQALLGLTGVRLARGDAAGAERAARRWVELQPDLPGAWRNLASTLAAVGNGDGAIEAGFHYVALAHDPLAAPIFARIALSARRYDVVDSIATVARASRNPIVVQQGNDVHVMLLRERGRFAEAAAYLAALPAFDTDSLLQADNLAHLGRLGEARAIWESNGHPRTASRTGQFTAPEARGFSWAHALEADALARAGDTLAARALIDSLVRVSAQSYYDRDKRLADHVRGQLLSAQGKYGDAVRAFQAATWMANGWTRTNVELARAALAMGRPDEAVAALRDAHLAPLDAMGRYVPHSELDWWMARAFAAAGRPDSARAYADRVRAAWRGADAAVRLRLDSLTR